MLNPYVCICHSNTKELTLVDILGVLSNKFFFPGPFDVGASINIDIGMQ